MLFPTPPTRRHPPRRCPGRWIFSPLAVVLTLGLTAAGNARAGNPGESPGRVYTSVQRMSLERLEAAHGDVKRHQSRRRRLPPLAGLTDYRAILHAHAEDARHTAGTRAEMLEAAGKAGVSIILLTDHYRPPRDFMDSWRGLRQGVLFVPGAEARGFLLYPDESIMGAMEAGQDELVARAGQGTGMLFLSHVEERVDHPLDGLTGMEIYNRHADAKDDRAVLRTLANWVTDPEQAAQLQTALELYPDELLAAQLDYPSLYLAKWDRETQTRPVVGVAANDCHHNQVFVVKMVDEATVRLGTVVDDDEDMRLITADRRPGIREMTVGHQPGETLLRFDFDPYERAFRTVSTHLLAPSLTEEAVRSALRAGHAYVSHDWMCDPTGFRFYALAPPPTAPAGEKPETPAASALENPDAPSSALYLMGEELTFVSGQRLIAEFPLECRMRLVRNGQPVVDALGSRLEHVAESPGVYRVEGWLKVDGEERIWIYSNPLYLR